MPNVPELPANVWGKVIRHFHSNLEPLAFVNTTLRKVVKNRQQHREKLQKNMFKWAIAKQARIATRTLLLFSRLRYIRIYKRRPVTGKAKFEESVTFDDPNWTVYVSVAPIENVYYRNQIVPNKRLERTYIMYIHKRNEATLSYVFTFKYETIPIIHITHSTDKDRRYRLFYNMLNFLISDYAVQRRSSRRSRGETDDAYSLEVHADKWF